MTVSCHDPLTCSSLPLVLSPSAMNRLCAFEKLDGGSEETRLGPIVAR